MSVQAMGWVLEHSPVEGTARLVLLSLANHAGKSPQDGAFEAWPGIETIRREARLSKARTVQDALSKLVACGAIERIVNGAPDDRIRADRRPNLYRILIDGVSCEGTPQENERPAVQPHPEEESRGASEPYPVDEERDAPTRHPVSIERGAVSGGPAQESGMRSAGIPLAPRGAVSRQNGVPSQDERGAVSRQNGVHSQGTRSVSEPLGEPSEEPSVVGASASEKGKPAKRITNAFRERMRAEYPHLDEADEFERATNHRAYLKAIDKQRYYQTWLRKAEHWRQEREGEQNHGTATNGRGGRVPGTRKPGYDAEADREYLRSVGANIG